MPELRVRNLSVANRSGPMLQDISFHLYPGEPLGLVGPSGAGKTMLSRALLGLLPAGFEVTAGHMWLDDTEVACNDADALAAFRGKRIGLLLQHPHPALDPVARVGEQMLETLRVHGNVRDREDGISQVLSWLNRMSFTEPELVYRQYPFQLSGGMARRVYLAMVLMLNPDVLIADEPTSGLDGVTAAGVMGLIRRESENRCLVIITHDARILDPKTDRISVMVGGEMVEEGNASLVLQEPGHPFTRRMMDAIAGKADSVPDNWERNHRDGFCGYRESCPVRQERCENEPVPRVERNSGWVKCHRYSRSIT